MIRRIPFPAGACQESPCLSQCPKSEFGAAAFDRALARLEGRGHDKYAN